MWVRVSVVLGDMVIEDVIGYDGLLAVSSEWLSVQDLRGSALGYSGTICARLW